MRPLTGIEVVSLGVNLPRPLAAARLAELGASVVEVEPPTGDPLEAIAAREDLPLNGIRRNNGE